FSSRAPGTIRTPRCRRPRRPPSSRSCLPCRVEPCSTTPSTENPMPKTSGSARKKAKRTSGQRAGVTKALVLETAARLADVEGLSLVTLARLASELDVKTPSLYSHVRSLDEVHQ